MTPFGIFSVSLVLGCLLTFLYIKYFKIRAIVDVPNDRSSHRQATPRGGGIIFPLFWSLVIFCDPDPKMLPLAWAGIAIATVGFLDDMFKLSAKLRLLMQFLATFSFLYAYQTSNVIDLGVISFVLPLPAMWVMMSLYVVWSINLFNFMDGINGIASVEGLMVIANFALLAFSQYNVDWFGLSLIAVSGAIFSFLFFNFPRAKIFMGDAGSTFLGFLIGVLSVIGPREYGIPIYLVVLPYTIFLWDATSTLLRRWRAGEKLTEAHRSHDYQRLHHIAGWSHTKVVMLVFLINLGLMTVVYLGFKERISASLSLTLAALLLGLFVLICRLAIIRGIDHSKT